MKKRKLIYIGNQLAKHGFTPTSVETLGEHLKESFDVVQGSDKQNKLFRLFHMWWIVIRNRKSDYLLIDTYSTSSFHYAWTSAILSRWFRIRYIPILHGGDLPKKAVRSPKLLKYFLNNAYEVVCPSNFLKNEMEKLIGGNYTVIPNVIDLKNYTFQQKSIDEKNGIRILWVRSFHKIYNPYLAIKILRQLHDKGYRNSELCMVGPDKDGSMKRTKQLAIDLDMSSYVRFTGLLSKKKWIELSQNYNIFINTTNVDNTPVSVIEAMALGFPIVTTNVGGIPYLFKDRIEGIMIEPNNPKLFVDEIEAFFLDSSRTQNLSNNARKRSENWDWLHVKEEWSKLLTK